MGPEHKRKSPLIVSLQKSYSADIMPSGNRPVANNIFALFLNWKSSGRSNFIYI